MRKRTPPQPKMDTVVHATTPFGLISTSSLSHKRESDMYLICMFSPRLGLELYYSTLSGTFVPQRCDADRFDTLAAAFIVLEDVFRFNPQAYVTNTDDPLKVISYTTQDGEEVKQALMDVKEQPDRNSVRSLEFISRQRADRKFQKYLLTLQRTLPSTRVAERIKLLLHFSTQPRMHALMLVTATLKKGAK